MSLKIYEMFYFEKEAVDQLHKFIDIHKPGKIIVIDDENTHKFCLPVFQNKIPFEFETLTIPSGDTHKHVGTLQEIWKSLINKDVDRNSLIINLGGGVVTDIGGFAATTFKRGLKFIHIPTSLLGMVDAAIGGKNGINFEGAKNQIGNIKNPEMVLIRTEFLKTLSDDEMNSGFAEMLKHGLIADFDYWEELLAKFPKDNIDELIKKSIRIKNTIVQQDPYEKGMRKALNFGHTLGHAIESYSQKINQPLKHGHAVAIGMILAAFLSYKRDLIDITFVNNIKENILKKFSLPLYTEKEISEILKYLIFDKKNKNGNINFVLLSGKGQVVVDQVINDMDIIKESFDYLYK